MTKEKMNMGVPSEDERRLFYSDSDLDKACAGHLRINFDSTGTGFYSTWFGRNNDLNDSQFKKDIDLVINMLRKDLLQSRNAMRRYLCEHEGLPFPFDSCEGKGFKVETEANVFYLRCLPMQGNYDCYCYGYNKELLEQALAPNPEQEDTMEIGGINQ